VGVLILGWTSRLDAFSAYSSQGGYPALHLAVQLVHQCLVPSGPLVLGRAPSELLRPRRIRTELSHDALNPTRVPL